jgi:alkylation response protein AidB-like acyl-CoA dehydrogenase
MGRTGPSSGPGRALAEARREAEAFLETYKWYPQRAGRADLLPELVRAAGAGADPATRHAVARALSTARIGRWTAERARAARAGGRTPGPEGSIGKLAASQLARQAAAAHARIAGAGAMLVGPDSPHHGVVAEIIVSVPAQSIAGGTDEVQRNIVAEKQLGLPREPSTDAGRPFRELPRNA